MRVIEMKHLLYMLFMAMPSVVPHAAALHAQEKTRELSPAGVKSGSSEVERRALLQASVDAFMARRSFSVEALRNLNDHDVKQAVFERMEKEFASEETDRLTRIRYAATLVRAGSSDARYWNTLYEEGDRIVSSTLPSPIAETEAGKAELNPEFRRGAVDAGKDPELAAQESLTTNPIILGFIAQSKDERASALLRRGLMCRDYQIQILSAKFLADDGDSASVPPILSAVQEAPPAVAPLLAESLLSFPDNRLAQATAERYLPADYIAAYRAAEAKSKDRNATGK